MRELIESGLLYGNLERVESPHMVARYNAALAGLGLQPTVLESFHVDAAGYSPEVAQEKGDLGYLDPQGVNRLFIVLTPRQRNLPIIRTHFSVDQAVYRRFLDANVRAIETLTLKDAVYGEMENLVLSVDTPADVLSFRKIDFVVRTPSGVLEKARDLSARVADFPKGDAWRDAARMEAIVEGARHCGDVRRNGILPEALRFSWPDVYHTSHLGGAYVIRGRGEVTMIGDPARLSGAPDGVTVLSVSDAASVLRALDRGRLLEAYNPDWLASGVLDHRIAMAAADALLRAGRTVSPEIVTDDRLRSRVLQSNHDLLKSDERFRALHQLRALIANGGDDRAFHASLPFDLRLATLRASPDTPDVWEANRLVAEFARFDLVSLFIVNKPLFYSLYEGMPEATRRFAVATIKAVYQPDVPELLRHKHSVRERFFGTH